MTTLVIHPDDRSTDFLKDIYKNIPHTLVNKDYSDVEELMREHDRIMMMGHGSPNGLFDLQGGFAISNKHILILAKKKENFYIWCHANLFVETYELPGFYTGMFISEVEEARIFNIDTTQEEVDLSNKLFAENLGKIIDEGPVMLTKILSVYSGTNPVIQYNSKRLRYSSSQN
jgi:hypothetical protein